MKNLKSVSILSTALLLSGCGILGGSSSKNQSENSPTYVRDTELDIQKISLSEAGEAIEGFRKLFIGKTLAQIDFEVTNDQTVGLFSNIISNTRFDDDSTKQTTENMIELKEAAEDNLNRLLNSHAGNKLDFLGQNYVSGLSKKKICSTGSLPRVLIKKNGELLYTYYQIDTSVYKLEDCEKIVDQHSQAIKSVQAYLNLVNKKLELNYRITQYVQNASEGVISSLKYIVLDAQYGGGSVPAHYPVLFLPWLKKLLAFQTDFNKDMDQFLIKTDSTVGYDPKHLSEIRQLVEMSQMKLELVRALASNREAQSVVSGIDEVLKGLKNIE